jgi:hypothetical protein
MQIENLAAVVHAIAKSCGAKTVVDVGSGQVCHLHASSCAIVTRFQVDTTIFLILGQLASFFIALSCDYAILRISFMYSLLSVVIMLTFSISIFSSPISIFVSLISYDLIA